VRRALEDLLLEEGLLDEATVKQLRRAARHAGVALVRALVEEGRIGDEALAELVARKLELPRVDLQHEPVDDDAIREVPFDLADGRRLLPLTIDRSGTRKTIRVAMADPLDRDATEEIELSTGCYLEPLVARVGQLADAAQRYYRGVITKMIPRRPVFGDAQPAPSTKPTHQIADEATVEVKLAALVELLVERGAVEREAFEEAVRKLLRSRAE
jgi:MshEN domain